MSLISQMKKFRALLPCIALTVTAHIADAEPISVKAGAEVLHLIRKEKFDLILPGAMRDNNIEMWIHTIRLADPDPMALHFGAVSGYIIFTDRGGNRIERAVLGIGGQPDLYDIFGSPDDLAEFVAERDPESIAVNTSAWLAVADGISHSEYLKLESALGPKYCSRIESAENVISDFRVRRTQREIIAFANVAEMHRLILERALSNEVIIPGVTTLGDVGWWVQEELHKEGLSRGYFLPGERNPHDVTIPRILYTENPKAVTAPDVRWWVHYPEYVIQRGDFGTFKFKPIYLNSFTTDYKRNFYVLREGETTVPGGIQHAYDRALTARTIIRKNIKVGETAEDTLRAIVSALEAEAYIHTPFTNNGKRDYKLVQETIASSDQSGFTIDLHSMGNNNIASAVGPSVAPFRLDRAALKVQQNHIFSLEYQVHTALPERPGYPISINIEGNHIVTSRGVEWLHPPNARILLIH